jgi:hypothetical protein
MRKNLSMLAIGIFMVVSVNATYAQSARSLFSANSGVTFTSNANQGKEKPLRAPSALTENKQQYLGISYTIFRERDDGSMVKSSPQTIFKTGDRIKVQVVTNTSGHLQVLNIDPKGNSTILSRQIVQAGSPVNIPTNGYLKFVGAKGIEEIVFILSSSSTVSFAQHSAQQVGSWIRSCNSRGNTRALVIDDSAGNEFNVLNPDGTCAAKPADNMTRGLVVDVEDNTGYGVVPGKALQDGQVLSLKIKLRHN